MGLMYARKLAAKKAHAANKAQAHRKNHKAAHAAFAKEEEAKAETLLPKVKSKAP